MHMYAVGEDSGFGISLHPFSFVAKQTIQTRISKLPEKKHFCSNYCFVALAAFQDSTVFLTGLVLLKFNATMSK